MEKQELKDRLKAALDMRGWRAVDLIEATGIPKGTISYYLSGKTEPKADRLYIIAKALDVSEAWLLGYDVEMARTPEQKKNDQLAALVDRMRKDNDFFETVAALGSLSDAKYKSIQQLLSALQE